MLKAHLLRAVLGIRLLGWAMTLGVGCMVVAGVEDGAINAWSRAGDGPPGERTGSVLVFARDSNRLLRAGVGP